MRQSITGVSEPTALSQRGSEKQELHCPLPRGNAAVGSRSSTPHSLQAVRHCTTAHCPLTTTRVQLGTHSAVQVWKGVEAGVETRERPRKNPFFLKMRQWWPPQHKGGVRKSAFPML